MELLLKMHRPATIELVETLPPSVIVQGVEYTAGFAPWPASPDLLIDPDTNAVVGVASIVSKEYWDLVRRVATILDPSVVSFNSLTSDESVKQYNIDPDKSHVLEIVWSDFGRVEYLPALLTEDMWYTDKSADGDHPVVAAFGIRHLQSVLKEFGLCLPPRFKVP